MTKSLSAALLTVLCLSLLVAPVRAEDVPAGKAAVIEAIIGRVHVVVLGGKSAKPKVGQVLAFGDALSTGSNGRVSLRHADNAVTRLAPNTELTLTAPGERKGVFLSLTKGLIRFLVGHRKPGYSFEVETSNAVAAVKGTDGSVETDGKVTHGAVFSSSRQKAMDFLNRATGEKIMLSPGETAGLDDKGFNTRELNKDDFTRSEGSFKGLPPPVVEGTEGEGGGTGTGGVGASGGAGGAGGTGGIGEGGSTPGSDAAQDSLGDAISDAFGSVMADLGVDSLLEHDDRTGDLAAGRIAYDRNGDRTQISSYVLRSTDTTIAKATFSKRETGPFTGTSFAEEATTWNAKLPEDWASVAKRALADPANLDGTGYPIFWKTHQDFRAGNPKGDTLQVLRDYQIPLFQPVYNAGTTGYDRGAIFDSQGFTQDLYMDGTAVQHISWVNDTSYYESDPNSQTLIGDNINYDYDNYWATNDSNTDPPGGLNADGTYSLVYSVWGTQQVFLQTDVAVLTQNGQKLDAGSLVPVLADSFADHFLHDFRGLNNNYNIELTFKSIYFSAPIDLLVIPEIFDKMDMFDVPKATNWPS